MRCVKVAGVTGDTDRGLPRGLTGHYGQDLGTPWSATRSYWSHNGQDLGKLGSATRSYRSHYGQDLGTSVGWK